MRSFFFSPTAFLQTTCLSLGVLKPCSSLASFGEWGKWRTLQSIMQLLVGSVYSRMSTDATFQAELNFTFFFFSFWTTLKTLCFSWNILKGPFYSSESFSLWPLLPRRPSSSQLSKTISVWPLWLHLENLHQTVPLLLLSISKRSS